MKKILYIVLALCAILALAACGGNKPAETQEPTQPETETETEKDTPVTVTKTAVSADDAIKNITSLGFVDADGSKLKAIAVEYDVELEASSVTLESFEVENYSILKGMFQTGEAIGSDPGTATKVYLNDAPETTESGKDSGNYVIIEVNTDYMLQSVPMYTASMIAGVKQVGEISGETAVVSPSSDFIRNYTEVENESSGGGAGGPGGAGGGGGFMMGPRTSYIYDNGGYRIEGIEGYELHYKAEDERYDAAYPAFLAEHCFDEGTGEYGDVELPYALFVPADYDASQKYALVLHILDAGSLGSDPMVTLTEGQGPSNFASDAVQQLAKDQGLGGIIVLAPQIEAPLRTTRDNWTTSAGVPATWQLMDVLTEQYNIDMDRIYGTGQSMGGMQVIAMAGQRDNYFAGLWMLGMQWGNNYDKDAEYNGAPYFSSDDPTIWRTDDDGNDSDLGNNWYYLLSDDNVLFTNCLGDTFSCRVWQEMDTLYTDIAGASMAKASFHPLDLTVEEQNSELRNLLAVDSEKINYHWMSFDGGSHMMTWVYGHRLDAGYEWLLSQNRQTEHDRSKLEELNRPWKAETDPAKIAAKQTEDRLIGTKDDQDVYLAVPAEGAGTIGYNSGMYGVGGGTVLRAPGWTK